MADAATSEGRRVRTVEGARFFGLPVGQVIQPRQATNEATAGRATTLTRLMSLQTMFAAAKRTGNIGQMKDIQEQFTAAVKDYAANTGQLPEMLDTLVGARGRADMAVGKKKGLKD